MTGGILRGLRSGTLRGPLTGGARGQASTEYLVVLVFMVVVLIVATVEPSPVAELAAAIKKFFAAYSYAISLTP